MTTTTTTTTSTTTIVSSPPSSSPPLPQLVVAAQRLERLLIAESSLSEAQYLSHSSPSKLVKRWLGTSSGIASIQKSSLEDVAQAAKILLNPQGPCATGRDLLVKYLAVSTSGDDSTMMDIVQEGTTTANNNMEHYLKASEREIEAWLITIAIRILISKASKQQQQLEMTMSPPMTVEQLVQDAIHLSTCGVQLLSTHLQEQDPIILNNNNDHPGRSSITNPVQQSISSLYPFFARMIRYRQWAYEMASRSQELQLHNSRVELANMYRTSVLRRDVDTQAAVMNCLLRHLLQVDQGIYIFIYFIKRNHPFVYIYSIQISKTLFFVLLYFPVVSSILFLFIKSGTSL